MLITFVINICWKHLLVAFLKVTANVNNICYFFHYHVDNIVANFVNNRFCYRSGGGLDQRMLITNVTNKLFVVATVLTFYLLWSHNDLGLEKLPITVLITKLVQLFTCW
jgi:hypothetical protein